MKVHLPVLCLTLFFLLVSACPAPAHLCDNVFRQADKLIVKPEVYNIVVKGKTSFKVFLQNNMDRGIAEIMLKANSQAFDFDIEPRVMSIPKDQKTFFQVTLTPRKGTKSGNYPVVFRLVGGGREFKTFQLGTETGSALEVPRATGAPTIDGNITDGAWKKAAVASNFSAEGGGKASLSTVALLTFDDKNLYLGVYCSGKGESPGAEKMVLTISPNDEAKPQWIVAISPRGAPYCCKADGSGTPRDLGAKAVKCVSRVDKGNWSAELALPFKLMGTEAPRSRQTYCLRLERKGALEKSYWSADASGYNKSSGLGQIILLPGTED